MFSSYAQSSNDNQNSNTQSSYSANESLGIGDGLRVTKLPPEISLTGTISFVKEDLVETKDDSSPDKALTVNSTIYTLNLITQELNPVTTKYVQLKSNSLNKDKTSSLFTLKDTRGSEISIFDKLTQKESKIESSLSSSDPVWGYDSDNSPFVVLSSQSTDKTSNIFKYSIKDKTFSQLTNFKGKNYAPSISSDGNHIAYTTDRFWPGSEICVFSLKDKIERCVLNGRTPFQNPIFSNNSKLIAFNKEERGITSIGVYNIKDSGTYYIDLNDRICSNPAFSPDDQYIIFSAFNSAEKKNELYIYDIKNSKTHLLISGRGSLKFPSWVP